MAEPVDTAIRVLAHRGPTWRAPLVIDVLRSLPIMRQVRTPLWLLTLLPVRVCVGRLLSANDPNEACEGPTSCIWPQPINALKLKYTSISIG